jgi:hypothetical protein
VLFHFKSLGLVPAVVFGIMIVEAHLVGVLVLLLRSNDERNR